MVCFSKYVSLIPASVTSDELVFLQPVEYNSYFAGTCISWRRDANGGAWQPHYRITDHLGSTRLETSSNGTITAAYDYKPFGEQIPLMTTTTRKTYIGKERDDESYLGDFGVRKYDYAAGRFTSPDVMFEKYMTWSPYQYSMNNPINLLDDNGMLIIGTNSTAKNLIAESVESRYENMVVFNRDGSLSSDGYAGKAIDAGSNMEKLIFLNKQNDNIIVDAVSEKTEIQSRCLNSVSQKVNKISEPFGNNFGLAMPAPQSIGNGKAMFYENIQMSKDKDSHIYLNNKTANGATAAHELFLHTYLFYNKKNKSHNSWFCDPLVSPQNFIYNRKLDQQVQNAAGK